MRGWIFNHSRRVQYMLVFSLCHVTQNEILVPWSFNTSLFADRFYTSEFTLLLFTPWWFKSVHLSLLQFSGLNLHNSRSGWSPVLFSNTFTLSTTQSLRLNRSSSHWRVIVRCSHTIQTSTFSINYWYSSSMATIFNHLLCLVFFLYHHTTWISRTLWHNLTNCHSNSLPIVNK